jgi:uncharacterized repeat protein (TIGR03803 family)
MTRRTTSLSKLTPVFAAALILFCAASACAQTFTVLATFDGTASGTPEAALVQAEDGNLYGTNYGAAGYPFGSLFKITRAGALTTEVLFGFVGGEPRAAMILATDGNLYGTTTYLGTNEQGTAFRYSPGTGALTVIYNYCSLPNCTDGALAHGLIQASDGNLYGTTQISYTPPLYPGVVYKMTPAGVQTTLYTFCSEASCDDGWDIFSGVVQDNDGNLYGTSFNGGSYNEGTVYKLTPANAFTLLHTFTFDTDGAQPGGLVQAANGILFGISSAGGAYGEGNVFKITTSGTLTTLHSFCAVSGCPDGSVPSFYSSLILGSDGNFYGTTTTGGSANNGTIFKITPGGAFTSLHSFSGFDGAGPIGSLMQATDGNFYGTTNAGGTGGYGTVFKLATGLAPFVKTVPTVGHVGTHVIILGDNLSAATSVTFDGTPATFTVVSGSALRATVPAGATTGAVKVTTPSGTLNSSVVFRVM